MSSAAGPYSSYPQEISLRRRAVGFVAAALANLLLLLMLFTLAPGVTRRLVPDRTPTVVQLTPDRQAQSTPTKTPKKTKRASGAAPRVPTPVKAPIRTKTEVDVTTPAPALNMIIVSKDVLAATDRAMNAPHAGPTQSAGSGTEGDAQASGSGKGAGTGPGGETLYAAEWYKEPTDAELSGYLPKTGQRTGWGEVACRTIANYQVEDCVEIGQSPPGSGLARAVRQAAWQFRVRPPRVGDRRMVGAWVRIRITYSVSGASG